MRDIISSSERHAQEVLRVKPVGKPDLPGPHWADEARAAAATPEAWSALEMKLALELEAVPQRRESGQQLTAAFLTNLRKLGKDDDEDLRAFLMMKGFDQKVMDVCVCFSRCARL